MMLRSGGGLDPGAIASDVRLVADGRVSPILLWEKHPMVIVGLRSHRASRAAAVAPAAVYPPADHRPSPDASRQFPNHPQYIRASECQTELPLL